MPKTSRIAPQTSPTEQRSRERFAQDGQEVVAACGGGADRLQVALTTCGVAARLIVGETLDLRALGLAGSTRSVSSTSARPRRSG